MQVRGRARQAHKGIAGGSTQGLQGEFHGLPAQQRSAACGGNTRLCWVALSKGKAPALYCTPNRV